MFDKELAKRIDDLIKDKFGIIYEYEFDGIVLLYGGTVRNLIMGDSINDLDFVILTQGECQILDFIKKFRLKYSKNYGDGYKISYDGFSVDMISKNDLIDTGVYDCDMLFYDIEKHMFISCGAINAFEKRVVTEINSQKKPLYSNKRRLKKIIKFIKYVSDSNKRVKVKQNKLFWEYKIFVTRVRINLNKIINSNFRKCFRFLTNCKKEFYFVLLLICLNVLISTVTPALSGKVITGILNKDNRLVVSVILLILLFSIVSLILSYLLSKLYLIVRKRMVFNIRKDIAKCVLNFELDNFNDNNRGVFIDKLSNDPNEITRIFNNIRDLFVKGLGNIAVLGYIFYLNYIIGFVLLFFMIIIFKIRMIGIKKRKKYRQAYFYDQEKCTSVLGEMINGVSEIKGLDLKDNYIKVAVESFENIGEHEFRGDYYHKFYNKIAYLIQLIASCIILILGLFLVDKGMLDGASLVVIYMYNSSVFSFLEKLGILTRLFSDLNISCDRVFSLLDDNMYSKDIFGDISKEKCHGEIEFDNVCFRYKRKNNFVLNDCSFNIKAGESVAVVGKSGTGKTTILNLIARLYNVNSGSVKIDGVEINDYNEAFIRDNVSIISQSPYLFDMSIKDNLRLVKDDVTDDEIKEVCKLVCMEEFIESLPNKYDTIIGCGGVKLSGGQKQRLGIARALIKNTKIILLDEITSALDNDTGTVIKKVINNIQKDHTIIIVTHELSMIKDCSRILILDEGKIVGDGTHQELINNNDIYKRLYKIK